MKISKFAIFVYESLMGNSANDYINYYMYSLQFKRW